MKIAFMTLGCPNWDLDTIITRGREYGFDGVDFRGYLDGRLAFRHGPSPNYRDARFTRGHDHHRWQTTASARSKIRRGDQGESLGIDAVVAAARRPAQGRA